jgi:hypothetical protein
MPGCLNSMAVFIGDAGCRPVMCELFNFEMPDAFL